ncbi:MAG TPA: PQQ-dependent sugar dehydrogenase, partial [Candidatus Polarisedimenticolia bacterium]|nr:PQQ-dependent sugar dehydrogenase [Candidatus Polarisedimenticolia bacterium]
MLWSPGLLRRFLVTSLLGAGLASAGAVGLPAADIALEPFLSGLSSPIFITHAGDGSDRLFVVEQGGVIKVVKPGSTTPTSFLDIADRVVAGGERGLLGLAFHPGYATNRRFFVNYTRLGDGATVIAEYRASAGDPNVADRAETVLLTWPQPFANHNGGMIAFGVDGYLYIGLGDGGSGNDPGARAQNIDELLGKILRIDVDHPASVSQLYSSPADNPFAGATPGRDEIYALGLRNPWRFSFDRQTHDLVAGDVGQSAREEVDLIVRGGNYGWRTMEGSLCTGLDTPCDPSRFVAPIAEYAHTGGRCSITGGYVYRGARGSLPSGSYIFGDYCTGEMFLRESGSFALLALSGVNISSFGEDEEGELYVVGLGGTVHRLRSATPCDFKTITPESLRFPAIGGSGVVGVTAAEGCEWTVSGGADWITLTAGSGGAGDGTVRYDVAVNTGDRSRAATLVIAGRPHTVFQAAPPRCTVRLGTTFL